MIKHFKTKNLSRAGASPLHPTEIRKQKFRNQNKLLWGDQQHPKPIDADPKARTAPAAIGAAHDPGITAPGPAPQNTVASIGWAFWVMFGRFLVIILTMPFLAPLIDIA